MHSSHNKRESCPQEQNDKKVPTGMGAGGVGAGAERATVQA